MTYKETLAFLYTQLPMYQRVGSTAFKKNLDNILSLCEALGNPQNQFQSIHIAGTNGKGTTAHMLSSVLQAHGKKTGLYTSPHYRDFRERIKIDGQLMPRSKVIQFVAKHNDLFKKIRPSFFEITVAMAFQHFAQSEVDIAVIETGLGGRLDSTNIIRPLLSVITNISLDHQNMLGDTLPEIAGEKAGIIKAGIPVVIGEEQASVKMVFKQKAKEMKSAIRFASQNYDLIAKDSTGIDQSIFDVKRGGKKIYKDLEVNAKGPFQSKNVSTLLETLAVLSQESDLVLKEDRLRYALKNLKSLTRYIGRWQILDRQPLTITDSAHNEGGLAIVMESLKQLPCENLYLVLGSVNDKDLTKTLGLFPKEAQYFFAKPNIPRGLAAEQLQEKAAAFGLQGRCYSSVKNAWRAAKRRAGETDVIFIGGSTFVVAEVV